MAQTGYTPILIYSSSTGGNSPAAGNLTNSTLGSELAINITDGKLFYKDNANVIQVIGWKVVPATAGGTGQTSYAVGDILYANTTTTLSKLADVATGNALISGGVNTAPSWGKIGLTTHVSGTLPIANGGTNQTAFTGKSGNICGLVFFDGTSFQNDATVAHIGYDTVANTFYANNVNFSGTVTLTTALPPSQGGTGITTTPSNGQIPIGNGTNYTAATLTAGGGIGITNAAGSVTIATSSPTFSAYGNAAQTLTAGVYTKAVLNAEDYDTNNNFDSTTNYRFTPTVAGYYQLNLKLAVAAGTSLTRIIADFRKNGNGGNNGRCLDIGINLGSYDILSASNLMYFNGSTDYCEIWVYLDGVGTLTISSNDKNTTFFQGSMIRAA